jgi:hypothetical protein
LRHSASLFSTFVVVLASDMKPPLQREIPS